MPFEEIKTEKEQSPEEIRSILEQALKEGRHVDLTILNPAGQEPRDVPDLIVEEMSGDDLMISYIAQDGEAGELIPLSFSRIKKAQLLEIKEEK